MKYLINARKVFFYKKGGMALSPPTHHQEKPLTKCWWQTLIFFFSFYDFTGANGCYPILQTNTKQNAKNSSPFSQREQH